MGGMQLLQKHIIVCSLLKYILSDTVLQQQVCLNLILLLLWLLSFDMEN